MGLLDQNRMAGLLAQQDQLNAQLSRDVLAEYPDLLDEVRGISGNSLGGLLE